MPVKPAKRFGKTVQRVRQGTIKKKIGVTPKLDLKTVEEIKLLKEAATILKKDTPVDWPKDVVPNVRAFGPLPEGWRHGKKITKATARGSGGKLLGCFVGPQGKVFYHKTDLEKFLGYEIEAGPKSAVRRLITPEIAKAFPSNGVLRRTDKVATADYITKRCDGAAGYGVHDALLTFTYESNGKLYNYGVSDLRYDIKCGLLALETDDKKKIEAAKQRIEQPSSLTKRTTTLATHRTTLASQRTKHKAKKASKTAQAAKPKSRVVSVRRPEASESLGSSASSSSSCGAAPWYSSGALRHIQKCAYGPLKRRAASGEADETAIFALLGVGYQFGVDSALLSVLPTILRKEPSARGEFGEITLKQFEAALNKHL